MTDFVQFVTSKYPNYIKVDSQDIYFSCGAIQGDICSTCPNESLNTGDCNYFTPDEVEYLQTNLPEILI